MRSLVEIKGAGLGLEFKFDVFILDSSPIPPRWVKYIDTPVDLDVGTYELVDVPLGSVCRVTSRILKVGPVVQPPGYDV